ncbi:MAG: sulfotransferase [Deltaproteobacteria bacterium]|nr:sulfotransferase [Deltaproteobacteria bacterium]MBW2363226.1 sulfotransferase [Deltaproteobacteria bacterium]
MAAVGGSRRARFVVGTGRCGSTLLSKMLAQNAEVLSLFEFFSGIDQFFRFRSDPVGGDELALRLTEDHPMLTAVLKRGYEVPEVVYPFDDPTARYARADPIPWTLAIAVARVSDTPDALFAEMLDAARAQPQQTLDRHYRQLLDWLTRRTGKSIWIERSGSSMDYTHSLKDFFPDARFVHLFRNGRETALSMREYAVLRLAVPVMNGLLGEVEYSHDGLVEFERRNAIAIDETLASRPPIELYGAYWSQHIEAGVAALSQVEARDVLHVRFETLVSQPQPVMREIAAFLEIPRSDADWLERACALVRGLPPTRFDALSPAEQERLEAACRPGMTLLEKLPC